MDGLKLKTGNDFGARAKNHKLTISPGKHLCYAGINYKNVPVPYVEITLYRALKTAAGDFKYKSVHLHRNSRRLNGKWSPCVESSFKSLIKLTAPSHLHFADLISQHPVALLLVSCIT